jgi:hypothetical protein
MQLDGVVWGGVANIDALRPVTPGIGHDRLIGWRTQLLVALFKRTL